MAKPEIRPDIYTSKNGFTAKGATTRFILDVAVHYAGDDCLVWPFARNPNGYGNVLHSLFGTSSPHRAICRLVHGAPPTERHQAAHRCGNGKFGCVNPKHLYWATPKENTADAVRVGRQQRHNSPWRPKLTPEMVREIRALQGELSSVKVGARYGVTCQCVLEIWRRNNWKWLD